MLKMTYPGFVLLFGVGVGLATFLYYMLAESSHEHEREPPHGSSRNTNLPEYDWRAPPHQSEKTALNRRRSTKKCSSKKRTEEKNIYGTSSDTNNCSICQYAITGLMDAMQLRPCRHNFHKDCINKLRLHNPTAPCPNCRRTITNLL